MEEHVCLSFNHFIAFASQLLNFGPVNYIDFSTRIGDCFLPPQFTRGFSDPPPGGRLTYWRETPVSSSTVYRNFDPGRLGASDRIGL